MQGRSFLASFVSMCLLVSQCLLVPAVQAGMVETSSELAREQRTEHKARVLEFLDRDGARKALERQGVAPAQVEQRLDNLSNAELARLADKADQLPAGEDVLGAVVLVLVILIVLDLLGATNIFPAIQPAN